MTKQIKTYYAQTLFSPYPKDAEELMKQVENQQQQMPAVVLKQDHDDIVNLVKKELREEIKNSNYVINKLVDALKFQCGDKCAEQNPCNAKEVLKEIGEL